MRRQVETGRVDKSLTSLTFVLAAFVGLAAATVAGPGVVLVARNSEPIETALYERFASAAAGPLPRGFEAARLAGRTGAPFEVAEVEGRNVLSERGGAPEDIVYFRSVPMASLEESYTFKYSGPASVVDPFFVIADQAATLGGYGTNLTETAPANDTAGEEFYEYVDVSTGTPFKAIRGRLRTIPYNYHTGHVYRVDAVADGQTRLLTTRVYDDALGPQTFDQGIKGLKSSELLYPGLMNVLGGLIAVDDFAFGPLGAPPVRPHVARRAYDYIDSLGYNAGVRGPATSPESLAFQKYFPDLGIRHVRVSADTPTAPTLNAVARFGVDADVLTGPATTISSLRSFIAGLALAPDSIELWNEPNNPRMGASYDENYAVDLPVFARALRAEFPKATIWGPSLLPEHGYPGPEQRLAGSLSTLIAGWNTHPYAARMPETTGYGRFETAACGATMREDCGWYGSMNWNSNLSAVLAPTLPGVATEGAGSYGSYPTICGHSNVSMAAQQAYLQRGMLYGFKLGYRRVYPYKFIDDKNCSDGFGKFGILNHIVASDGSELFTPKPAYTSLVYFNHLLRDDGASAASFEPSPLNYSLARAPVDVEELLLAESDGSYRLILWSDSSLWDFDANGVNAVGKPLPEKRERVTIKFDRRFSVTAYRQQTDSGMWVVASRQASALEASETISQFPLVIEIRPESTGNAMRELRLPTAVATPGPTSTPAPWQFPTSDRL
jgi:hypothetical protein